MAGVSGDNSFINLSDDDTVRYVNAHKATLPRAYTEAGAAANPPRAPQPLSPTGKTLPRQGFKENVIEPVEDIALGQLKTAGMVVGAPLGAAAGIESGPGAIASGVAGAGLGSAAGGSLERGIRRFGVGGHLPERPTLSRELVNTGQDFVIGAEGEMGAQTGAAIVGKVAPALSRSLSSPKKAAGLFERGVAPSGMAAEDQAVMRENFNRAQKYIAPETRGYPIEGGEGGAMRSAQVAHRAGENLWKGTVEPVVDLFKNVQRPGDDIGKAIRGSFTDLDKQTKPAAVNAGEQLAKFFEGRPISVGEMADLVKQLNNDRGVARFYDMSPNEQAAAELADPSLRSKVTTLRALREKMFDAIGDSGGERLGKQFREARKDWGAIRSVEDQMRGTRVPTPQPLLSRAGNTLRGMISLRNPDSWMRTQETLFNLNNPNRLLPKSLNMLGRTDLEAPMLDVQGGKTVPRAMLGSGPVLTPPPTRTSGPVDLGKPEVQPLAENRQLPAVGRTSGPRTVAGPSQYGLTLPETTPRPLTGPERQLPRNASPTRPDVPFSRNKVWQKPPNIQLGPSSLPDESEDTLKKSDSWSSKIRVRRNP